MSKRITKKEYNLIYEALSYYNDYLSYKEERNEDEEYKVESLNELQKKIASKCYGN